MITPNKEISKHYSVDSPTADCNVAENANCLGGVPAEEYIKKGELLTVRKYAEYAETQGNYAKIQGQYAKAQGEIIEEKMSNILDTAEYAKEQATKAKETAEGAAGKVEQLDDKIVEVDEKIIDVTKKGENAANQAQYAEEQAKKAENIRNAIEVKLNNGEFKGKQGEPGTVIQEEEPETPTVLWLDPKDNYPEVSEYDDTGIKKLINDLQNEIKEQAKLINILQSKIEENEAGINKKSNETIINEEQTELITLQHNTEYRRNFMANLYVGTPEVIVNNFISSLIFSSGSVATVFSYNSTYFKFIGADTKNNVFTPKPNMTYCIIFYYDGTTTIGIVGGYKQ